MFVGTYEHSLDDKGRLVLPPTYRSRLSEGGFVSPLGNCLALWTPPEFEAFVGRLREKVRNQEATPGALRVLTANANEIKPDGQGRITIPGNLRTLAGLHGSVVLTGAIDHIEVRTVEQWAEVNAGGSAELADAVNNLGIF